MVEHARAYTDKTNDFDILCEIQHRGGRTNQIDFTRDLGVALFFACGSEPGREDEPGRVVMLQDWDGAREAGVSIRDITHPIHLAAAQKSVFVSTDSGYLDDRYQQHIRVWTIDPDEKATILRYLKDARGIDARALFMDISGFIKNAHQFENTNAIYHRIVKLINERDLDGALQTADKHIQVIEGGFSADPFLYLRGRLLYNKGDLDRAFQDLRRVRRVMRRRMPTAAEIAASGTRAPIKEPAYPLPANINKELDEWCERQSNMENESAKGDRKSLEMDRDNRLLECVIEANTNSGVERQPITFDAFTSTGYSYSQTVSGDDPVVMTWPSYFINYDSIVWWSFHGPEHRRIVTRSKVGESARVDVPPKTGSSVTPCRMSVTFFAYDPSVYEIKRGSAGKYGLVAIA